MSDLKKINMVLNTQEPEDLKLYNFVTQLPNGKRRNASKFLRLITERAYQEEQAKKKAVTTKVIRSNGGGIKYSEE